MLDFGVEKMNILVLHILRILIYLFFFWFLLFLSVVTVRSSKNTLISNVEEGF